MKKDYPLDDEEAIGFDRESSSRQSFSEKRKQASMSPPMTEKLIEYRSLNRKKSSHGNFIELTIWRISRDHTVLYYPPIRDVHFW